MVVGKLTFYHHQHKHNVNTLGFANGHYVMEKNSIFYYKLAYEGEFVDVDKQKTIKWNSNKFNIEWPLLIQ